MQQTVSLKWYEEWLYLSPGPEQAFGMKRTLWPLWIGLFYIVVIAVLGGLRPDHVFIGCLALLDFYNQKTRQFLRYFFPFILTGVIFDSMRYFYWWGIQGHIHVSEPYYRDLNYFGVTIKDSTGSLKTVTVNEYFAMNPRTWLDLLCGFAYLVFVGEYLAAGFFLFLKKQFCELWAFGCCFLTVNLLGYITYFIYPAAPPWYVSQYGLGPARMDVRPEAAAGHRFDHILGTHFFDQMYSRGIDVYGAYPSLHVAYPLLVVWLCSRRSDLRWCLIPALLFYFLMCLSAVYLQHHFIVDILLGSFYSVAVAATATLWLNRSN